MKKFYLLMMFALLGMVANAAEVTINFAEIYGASTISDISNESKTKDGFTFTFAKGNAQNPPAYNKAEEIRLYGGKSNTVIDGNIMTVSTEAGRVITKIVLTAGSSATWGELTSNIGSVTEDSRNAIWTGEGSSVTFTANRNSSNLSSSTQNRYASITITYEEVVITQVATPTFSVESGEIYPDTEIAINCATEGATIKYRLNEDPTVLDYSAPLVFSEIGKTVTVTAWAEAEGLEASEQAVATYNVVEKPATIEFTKVEDLSLLSTNDHVIIVCEDYNNAMSTTVSSNKIEPAEVSIDNGVINLPVNSTAAILSVTSLGENTFTFSNGSNYLYAAGSKSTNLNYSAETDRIGFTASNSGNGILLTIGTDTRSVLFNGSVFGYYATSNVGSGYYVVSLYKEVVDENQVAAPIFSLTSGTYEGAQSLTLDCETEGATIYYTMNGGEPQTYADAIELTEGEYAFVAWAEKDGMTKSLEVTANYTIEAPLVANSIAEFLTLGAEYADREITLNCDLTVTYQGSTKEGNTTRDLYVQDKDGKGLLIFNFDNPQLKKGDVISGVKGKYDFYNGVPELIEPVLGEVKETVEVAPVSVDASQLTVDNVNDYVVINNVELSEVNGADATLNDETATLALYNKYNACTYPEQLNKKYFVTGIVSVYKDAVQIYPLEITVDTESGVNDAVANEFKAVAVANGIEVNVAEAGLVSVYNAAGQLVANVNVAEGATTINVAGGFYIVKAGNNVAKVLVK